MVIIKRKRNIKTLYCISKHFDKSWSTDDYVVSHATYGIGSMCMCILYAQLGSGCSKRPNFGGRERKEEKNQIQYSNSCTIFTVLFRIIWNYHIVQVWNVFNWPHMHSLCRNVVEFNSAAGAFQIESLSV